VFLAADQNTSTTDAEEELFRRIVSEALFEKNCSRRYCSEDLVLNEKLLTTRTPRTSRTSRTPRTPRTFQFCSRRRIVSEALFEKSCLRRNVSKDLVLKKILLTSDIPDVPDIPDMPKEATKQFSTTVSGFAPAVKPRFSATTSDDLERSGWQLEDLASRKLIAMYRRDQCSDKRR